ncbi:MAG TPA: DUF3592 domain-containing protein [Allosphingosinicella sp.]|nr:DUF3592 domain-containing protein [Allosphingosinicella sp.]
MSRNTIIVMALLVLGAVFVGAMVYFASLTRKAQTAEGTATVVRAEREAKKGDDDTILTLSYRAGARVVQGRARVEGVHVDEYPAGRELRVCFDPANPSSVRLEDGSCG